MNLDHLVDGNPFPFEISSGLNKLLFVVNRDDGDEDVYAVSVSAEDAITTGPAVKIYEGLLQKSDFNIHFSLSPDGKWIAYSPEVVFKVRPESTLCEADFDEILEKLAK